MNMSSLRIKAQQYWQLFKHFRSPLFVMATRLGWPKLTHFSYQLAKGGIDYTMVGRPARGDLWVMREVLVEETYRQILSLLPAGPVRILDVGGHIGSFSVWLHRNHGISDSFCLE